MTPGRNTRQDSAPEAESVLAIARLGRPHGVRGEVRAEALCPPVLDFSELLERRPLWLRREGESLRPVEAAGVRPHSGLYLITLEGTDDRTQAESLRGTELCLERKNLPELPDGWYWEADLIGIAVEDENIGALGRVTGLEVTGAQPMLVVDRETPDPSSIQIPWSRGLVRSIDIEARMIKVDLPSGYPGLS